MAYKYLNDNGLKAYTKKVKGALKNLHTPIAISTENTTESMAQNVKNIADFVAKAKAAGITDVNGMAVTCLIDEGLSGVGYLYGDTQTTVQGVLITDDLVDNTCFGVFYSGRYSEREIITGTSTEAVNSTMLTQGARNPIILTPETTEVDEETYQKLLSDEVDVVFKPSNVEYCALTCKYDNNTEWKLCFNCVSFEAETNGDIYVYAYIVKIDKNTPHTCILTTLQEATELERLLETMGFLKPSSLSPVLQEIDLIGTDAKRKAKLAKFETDWKALTGARDLSGARFVGKIDGLESQTYLTGVFSYEDGNTYKGMAFIEGYSPYEVAIDANFGSITIIPLLSHLRRVTLFNIDDAVYKKRNLNNLNAYKLNLRQLGVDTYGSFQVPFAIGTFRAGTLQYTGDSDKYIGVSYASDTGKVFRSEIDATGKYTETLLALGEDVKQVNVLAQAVKAFGAIELKASDNAANKAALTAYLKILTDAGISTTNGYSVPVRITGNAQEYHGMLNIGTGALLSGIVTDVNENHHYPFNVSTADGAITFDANNYFLEKTSNEVTEMLDAIKYSYTPVPLTATTLSNKAQLEVFLSKVPTAQVMHCTYKDVYAGTLHKINGDWFGLLVKNTNNYEDALQVKLQADGTLIEGTTSLAQVNAKLDTIIG